MIEKTISVKTVARVARRVIVATAAVLTSAHTALAISIPVTANLLVNLNGDSTSNFIASGSNDVKVWKDLAENGSAASQQDFGQNTASRQPKLLPNTAVPNSVSTSINYNILDFDRSASVGNTVSSGSGSDVLKGKDPTASRLASYSDTFTVAADSSYEASNATGLSWFMVFRSSDQTAIINNNSRPFGNGSGNTTSRWGAQVPFDVSYATTSTAGADWIGTYLFTKNVEAPDTQINLSSHVRSIANNEMHNDPTPLALSNVSASTWYMMANSFNPVIGSMRTVLTTPDGSGGTTTLFDVTLSDSNFIIPGGLGNGGVHLHTALGAFSGSNGGTNDWSFDGLMAEVLIYNTALGTSTFDSVAGYLSDKYFNVPEPSSFVVFGTMVVIGSCFVRRVGRKTS